ncbi:Ankyrin repeats domain-containing protein [Phytophthora infestans]|uniref:Ankyrin repeats domain-containing protein n=1 Tax=Phytophthora infestans TaxID=4787 RepID=A0A8S9UF70_PHYIN|nr:Ankyrin repeats domain-containing protein [Phytophthora infestans]
MKRGFKCSGEALTDDALDDEKADKHEVRCPYKKLKDVHFPVAVSALPHVLAAIYDFATSPEAATISAIQNKQQDRYNDLKARFGFEGLGKTMAFAAEMGLLDVVQFIMEVDGNYSENEEDSGDDFISWESKRDAATVAASKGHLSIVQYLYPEIIFREYDSDDEDADLPYQGEIFKAAWDVLTNAAENGHLETVQFAVQDAKRNNYWHWYDPTHDSTALTQASANGHVSVVKFLLEDQENAWDIAKPFAAAATQGKQQVANMLYEAYSLRYGDLFVKMSTNGSLEGVKFLLNTSMSLNFYSVQERYRLGYLTKGSRWLRDLENSALTQLFGYKRASAQAISNALEKAGSLGVFQFLSVNIDVSDAAIIAAFKHAALYGTTVETIKSFSSEISRQCIEIVNALYMKDCIPAEVMSEAFAWTAFKQPIEVAIAMYTKHPVSREAVGRAFLNAVNDKRGLDLVKFLTENKLVDQNFLDEGVKAAAMSGRKRVVRIMYANTTWHSSVALELTRTVASRNFSSGS